jgi:multiple sugar transport system substrate-binding protein
LLNLNEALAADAPTAELLAGVPQTTLDNLNLGGNQYGFPYAGGGGILLYYNKDMFDAAGLEYPQSDWTLQDVVDAAKKLSMDTNSDGELDQWGYMPNYYNTESLDAIMHRFGARWFSEDGKTAMSDSPEAIQAMKFIQDIIYTEKISPRPQDVEGIDCPFCAGLIGMLENGSFAIGEYREITDFQWDVTLIPLGFEGQQVNGGAVGNPNFTVSAATEHPQEAMLLAAFMASQEGQEILGKAQGRMPVRPEAVELWATTPPDSLPAVLAEITGLTPNIVEPLCVPHSEEIDDAILRALEGEIITNSSPASEIMAALTQEIQVILDTP